MQIRAIPESGDILKEIPDLTLSFQEVMGDHLFLAFSTRKTTHTKHG
jgi:hypothetical protein